MANLDEIPRGQLSTIILMTLSDSDKYGYEIIDEVLKKTNGKMSIKQPSLYSSLKRMEDQSLISSYWRDSDIGGKRHYYHLTDLGKKHLEKWQDSATLPILEDKKETTLVLQQDNMFNNKANYVEDTKEINEKVNDKLADTFVQFDLFSNSTIVTPVDSSPVVENPTPQNISEQITNNKVQPPIMTEYEKKEPENIKKDFTQYILKKGNHSFADSIVKENTVKNKKFIEQIFEEKQPELLIKNTNEQVLEEPKNELTIENELDAEPIVTNKISVNNLSGYNPVPIKPDTQQEQGISSIVTSNENVDTSIENKDTDVNENSNNNDETKISINIKSENNLSADKDISTDDGKVITERLSPDVLPKPFKWTAPRYEIYLSDNSISPNLISKKNSKYEDRIKDLYEKSKNNAENQAIDVVESKTKFSTYKDLQSFYQEQKIKFKPYVKTLKKSERDFDMIRIHKLNMITSLFLFIFMTFISCAIGFSCKGLNSAKLNSPLTYIFPSLVYFAYFIICAFIYYKSPTTRIAYDRNKFNFNLTACLISLLVTPIIFAINMLFGFSFNNFNHYIITIIYPVAISLTYFAYYFIQKIVLKTKFVY